MAGGLHGRDGELARARLLLARSRDGSGGTLVVEGPRESGRSALLDAVASLEPGRTTLLARGVRDETGLRFAGVSDLCEPHLGRLDRLPVGLAGALRSALGLSSAIDEPHVVARALVALVDDLASDGPVTVLVDDAECLDEASAAAVAYLARRCHGRAAMFITQTPTSPTRLRLPDLDRIPLRPLEVAEARVLAATIAPCLDASAIDALVADADGRAGRLVRLATMAMAPGPVQGAAERTGSPSVGPRAEEADALEHRAAAGGPQAFGTLVAAADCWLAAGLVDRAASCLERAASHASADQAIELRLESARLDIVRGRARPAACALLSIVDDVGAKEPRIAARASVLAVPLLLHTDGAGAATEALGRARTALARLDHAPIELVEFADAAAIGIALATGAAADVTPFLAFVDSAFARASRVESSFLVIGVVLPMVWAERYDTAAQVLEAATARARATKSFGLLPLPLAALAMLERRRGNLDAALLAATEGAGLARRSGQRGAELFARAELANLHAIHGNVERCRSEAGFVLEASGGRGSLAASAASALATVELWQGNWERVVELLEPLVATATGDLAPTVTMYHQNLLAAYVQLGRLDDAHRLADEVDAQAQRLGTPRLLAVAARCKGLVAGRDDYDAHFTRSVALADESPFSRTLTRAFYALRLASDGRAAEAATVAADLIADPDTSAGTARAASALLGRLAGAEAADRTEVLDVTEAIDVRLLGGLAVRRGSAWVEPTGAPGVALAVIALRKALHVEELIDVLWEDVPPETGRQRLRNVLTRVRRLAGPVVERRGDRIQLAGSLRVDVHEFEAAATSGDYERAINLWRGPLLPGLLYEEWTTTHRRRLDVLFDWARRALVDRRAATGDHAGALALAEALLAEDPGDTALRQRAAELSRAAPAQSREVR